MDENHRNFLVRLDALFLYYNVPDDIVNATWREMNRAFDSHFKAGYNQGKIHGHRDGYREGFDEGVCK
jgi:hypothetical protein